MLSLENNANAGVGGIGIFLNAKAYKALVAVEMITNRIMVATFHGNPQHDNNYMLL